MVGPGPLEPIAVGGLELGPIAVGGLELEPIEVRGLDELARCDGDVGVFDDARDLVPVQPTVETNPEPAAMPDVRGAEVVPGVAVDERLLHPFGRRAPQRQPPVAVVVVEIHHEALLLADEERRLAVAEALARLGKREAQLADAVKRCRHGYARSPPWGRPAPVRCRATIAVTFYTMGGEMKRVTASPIVATVALLQ